MKKGNGLRIYSGSTHSQIIKVMKNAHKPLSVDEIDRKIETSGRLKGLTPKNTISSILQRSPFIERVEVGLYRLQKNHSSQK